MIFTNAIGYNPYENVHGNIHKEAIKMKKLLDETISNKEAKHLEEIKLYTVTVFQGANLQNTRFYVDLVRKSVLGLYTLFI